MTAIQEERTITYHTVTLGTLTRAGDALATINAVNEAGEQQAHVLHVPAGLPGELVTIAVEAPPQPKPGKRNRRWKPRPPRVWITAIHQPSSQRVAAPCPVFGTCGGCQLQHMDYAAQLIWKRASVGQALQEIGHFEQPPLLETVACDIPWHYRNHMRFSVNRDGQPGLTARGTHRVLPLTTCPIAHTQINRVLHILSQHPNPRPQALVRCSTASNQVMLQPAPTDEIAQQLTTAGLELHTATMEETLGGETFRIRPSSFFQTNTAQAEKMAQMVLAALLPVGTPSGYAIHQGRHKAPSTHPCTPDPYGCTPSPCDDEGGQATGTYGVPVGVGGMADVGRGPCADPDSPNLNSPFMFMCHRVA